MASKKQRVDPAKETKQPPKRVFSGRCFDLAWNAGIDLTIPPARSFFVSLLDSLPLFSEDIISLVASYDSYIFKEFHCAMLQLEGRTKRIRASLDDQCGDFRRQTSYIHCFDGEWCLFSDDQESTPITCHPNPPEPDREAFGDDDDEHQLRKETWHRRWRYAHALGYKICSECTWIIKSPWQEETPDVGIHVGWCCTPGTLLKLSKLGRQCTPFHWNMNTTEFVVVFRHPTDDEFADVDERLIDVSPTFASHVIHENVPVCWFVPATDDVLVG